MIDGALVEASSELKQEVRHDADDRIVTPEGPRRSPETLFERDERYGHILASQAVERSRTKFARAYRKLKAVLTELDGKEADEHGGRQTGVGHPIRSRMVTINVDIYGVDLVNGQPLGVVLLRRCDKKGAWNISSSRKSYFLLGRDELTQMAFAYRISSTVVDAAIRRDPSPASPVTAARAWIFDVQPDRLDSIIRHGVVALVPVKRLPAGRPKSQKSPMNVIDGHVLTADKVLKVGERLYALNPSLNHTKRQHGDVVGIGWYRVQVGLRASSRWFASPTAD